MTSSIAIPICPEQAQGLELESADRYAERVEAGLRNGELVIPMQPGGPVVRHVTRWRTVTINGRTVQRKETVAEPVAARELVVRMTPTGSYGPCLPDGELLIERTVRESGFEDVTMRPSLSIGATHPGHCGWRRTLIGASPDGVTRPHEIGLETRPQGGGVLGEADALDWPPTVWEIDDIRMAPGEMAQLLWEIGDGKRLAQYPAAALWWRTCLLSGGYVLAVHGAYGDDDISYTVRVQGQDVVCRPTDYTAYAVGEWVTVLDAVGGCSRTERCGAETGDGSPPSTGIIVPVRVLDRDINAALHEYALDFQAADLGRLMDLCAETGVVVEVDTVDDTMTVHVDGADLVPADVHYRCTPEGNVAGGSAAFVADDEVLILREPYMGRRVVVGFAGPPLRPCDTERSLVLCFLVQQFSCLEADLALQVGELDELYGWLPGSWSTHLARGNHLADDPCLEYYTHIAYCTPAYAAWYRRVYIEVSSDGSCALVADPVAAGYETADAWSVTRWRRVLATSTLVDCPELPAFSDLIAMGQELVAPTWCETRRLPDGSRLALAKSMAGFAAVLAPAPTPETPAPAVRTAYAVAEPCDLEMTCALVDPGGTEETVTICRQQLPEWYRSLTGIPYLNRSADQGACGDLEWLPNDVPPRSAMDEGDSVAMVLCPWWPGYEIDGVMYPGWDAVHAPCAAIDYDECLCHDIVVGSMDLTCIDCQTITQTIPPTYTRQETRQPTTQRDIIQDESDVSLADSVLPLAVTKPHPGPCSLSVTTDADTGAIEATASGGYDAEFASDYGPYADEQMFEGGIGCALAWDGNALTLATTGTGGEPSDPSGDTPEAAGDELTARCVDGLNHISCDLTWRKPSSFEVRTAGVRPVPLLARGRVWLNGLEDDAVSIDIGRIIDLIAATGAGAQGAGCAILRPWLCLKRGSNG